MKAKGILAASAVVVAVAGIALAQAPGGPPAQGQFSGPPPMEVPPPGSSPEEHNSRAPVLHITSVEVIRTTHAPVLDIIRVRGVTSSPGWEEGELVPLTRGVPADGVLQLVFVARAPGEAAEASAYEPIEAIFPLETNHPFKGVNVHSALESVSVSAIPGYAEGGAKLEDCGKCVGKYFIAKGASASGRGESVREEQLPAGLRVIRPNDGIANADSNPNRLTLILNKEGRIISAVWE
jgi:hypothetical protein